MKTRHKNGYGVSYVCHLGTYGYEKGLWELAVIKYYGPGKDDWKLNYDTPITQDVIGWLTLEQCERIDEIVSKLNTVSDEEISKMMDEVYEME